MYAALEIYRKREDYPSVAFQFLNMTRKRMRWGLNDSIPALMDSAYAYIEKSPKDVPDYYRGLDYLYEVKMAWFERRGMLDSAYHYSNLSRQAMEEAQWLGDQQEITRNEFNFALEKEREKIQFEQQRTRTLRIGLMILTSLMAILAFALFRNTRQQNQIREQNDLIQDKNSQLNQLLRKQSVLLSEIHHRVKNNLQLVVSMLSLQGNKSPITEVRVQFDDLSNKVRSIALIHDQLYRSGEFDRIDLADYFQQLAEYFQALDSAEESFAFHLNAEDLHLNLETVLPLGIIFTELISNSLKYGRQDGQNLSVSLNVIKLEEQFQLTYRDNGPGFPGGKLTRKIGSMGGLLIESMVRQLRAKHTSKNENGAVFEMKFTQKMVSGV
ncbi:MAG: sensor histidine kinase [Bacteroidota bacterium]